jgi:NADH-quinone oxidoreductase subunit N
MYFDAPAERFEPMPATLAAVLGISGIVVLFFFVYPAPLIDVSGYAAKSLF